MIQVNFESVITMFQPLTVETLKSSWERLHAGDGESFPRDSNLVNAWLLFHNGQFLEAAEASKSCEGGVSLQLKALATYAHYIEAHSEQKVQRFQEAVKLAEDSLVTDSGDKKASDENASSKKPSDTDKTP